MAVEKIERIREKWFRAIVPFGPYSKGALLKPTGIYRQTLLARKFIEEVNDDPIPEVPHELDNREIPRGSYLRRRGKA